ncbi:MAG: peptidoglycan-binding protein [Patescibacteria group bacterium]|jgi:peptidoglycan hydrolase-like protein with peptidoglycan-binding domain
MKKYLLILSLFLTLGIFAPSPAAAQILPACDKTIYIVAQGGWVQVTKGAEEMNLGYFTGKIELPAVYQHVTTPERYTANPLFYETEATAKNPSVTTSRPCGFNDFVQLFVNLINWGLSILTIVALFFFIWGGFTLLISGGRSTHIEEGKKILEGTVIGILVVLTAYVMVNFYISALIGDNTASFLGTTVTNPLSPISCVKTFEEKNAREAPGESCSSSSTLGFGCTDAGNDGPVHEAQRILNEKCSGICGTVTGCYGNETAHCVRMFQAAQGLNPTGKIDSDTWIAIRDANKKDCFTEKTIGEPPQQRTIKNSYDNPLGYPEYENVFPPNVLANKQFGGCMTATSGYACIPAHGPEECPTQTFYSTGTPVTVEYEYSATSCSWIPAP